MPHLRRQDRVTVIHVTSGLAFVPLARTPTCSATKAGLHSVRQSLRHQMRGSAVKVLALPPPAVQTDLMAGQATSPLAMPLAAFIAEVMGLLPGSPTPAEICVERVGILRRAVAEGRFDAMFTMLND